MSKDIIITKGEDNLPPKRKSNPLAAVLRELGDLETTKQFTRMHQKGLGFDDWSPHEVEAARGRIADCRAYVEGASYQETTEQIARAVELASRDFVTGQLDWLLAAWGNTGARDNAQSGFVLATFVHSQPMTRYAIAEACRSLISTSKFPPTTAEMLSAIAKAEEEIQRIQRIHVELSDHLKQASARLARCDERKEITAKAAKWFVTRCSYTAADVVAGNGFCAEHAVRARLAQEEASA